MGIWTYLGESGLSTVVSWGEISMNVPEELSLKRLRTKIDSVRNGWPLLADTLCSRLQEEQLWVS